MRIEENRIIKMICNVIILLLLIAVIIISVKIFIRYIENCKNEANKENLISDINNKLKDSNDAEIPYIEYEGYQVIGIIKIEKINLMYPILNANNEDSLKKSIVKFYGDKLNEIGNVTLAGHNNFDGTMFGKIKKLEIGDKITIIDFNNNSVTYEIFNKYITDPNDISIINNSEEGIKEITLITCTNGNKNRLIIKAKKI